MHGKSRGCDLQFHTWLHMLWLMGVLKCKSLITLSIQASSHIHTYSQCKTHNYGCDVHMQTQWWTLMGSHMISDWQIIWLIPELGLWLLCHLSKCVLNGTSVPVSCSGSSIHYSSLLAAESGCVSVEGCVIYLEAPVINENQTFFKGIFWIISPLMFMGCTTGILSITTDNNFELLLSLMKKRGICTAGFKGRSSYFVEASD